MVSSIDRSIVGSEFDRWVFAPVTEAEVRAYAEASGEPVREDGDALVAPVTFVLRLRGKRFMPANMPQLGTMGFDAGKDMELGVPVRVGDVLTVVGSVHDIYEKTGRSGTMAFVVLRTEVANQSGEHVATIDQRLMFR
ncbi:MaoC family dehydratase N-terminal domain-containing protein [Candidatus Binatia bacterium]|nr:MaoC family dehydratase N-terminal domain-containing protein [Candidatus Binatia bacterium]